MPATNRPCSQRCISRITGLPAGDAGVGSTRLLPRRFSCPRRGGLAAQRMGFSQGQCGWTGDGGGEGEIFLFCRSLPLILNPAYKPCPARGAETAGECSSDEEKTECSAIL